MFGHHDLYRNGVPARSVVVSVLEGVEVKDGHSKHEQRVGSWEVPHESPGQRVFYDVVANVEFGDGTTGQHTERLWRHDVGACTVGDVLPVRYDRQHRDKIVFDLPELEANRYSPKERVDGQPAHWSAPQVVTSARVVNADAVQELLSELAADPRGFADHIRQMAQEGGTNTFTFTSAGTDPAQQIGTDSGFPLVEFTDDSRDGPGGNAT